MSVEENVYDLIIIGAGPAGLTAGIYAARARMKVLLIESLSIMGQATMTDSVENYPGVDDINGFDLILNLKSQAENFGLIYAQDTITNIEKESDTTWSLIGEKKYKAISVIIATGAQAKQLGVKGEIEKIGAGVSYCATCDAAFFKDKKIIVVGGGETAIEEAIFLTRFAKEVKIIHRKNRLRATKIVQERAFENEKITFVWQSVIKEIVGEHKVEKVIVENIETKEKEEIECDGVFVFVGWTPNTKLVKNIIKTDELGYILVDSEMKTTQDGIFAAGDCTQKLLRQIVTACGDGATSAFSAMHYVDRLKGEEYV